MNVMIKKMGSEDPILNLFDFILLQNKSEHSFILA
jgi:hypothetical protein